MNSALDKIDSLFQQVRECAELTPAVKEALIAALTRLAELESNFALALEQEKLASLKAFAYGASHEINNPLANISTRAQSLCGEESHPERRRKLAIIVAQAMRAHEMISDLMLFAKPPPLRYESVALNPLLAQVLSELQAEANNQATQITLHVEPAALACSADATQLAVAVKSLVRNGIEALGSGGLIEVTAWEQAEQVVIKVRDSGPGISQETRRHLFDPFYSGREAGRGLGFGLPKCWRIAELHGGRMEVESELGSGTEISILLPRRNVAEEQSL